MPFKPAGTGAILDAIEQARVALDTLLLDVELSNAKPRQRTLTKCVREAMNTVDWVIAYDVATCNHAGAKNA